MIVRQHLIAASPLSSIPRRGLVVLAALGWLLLASPWPVSLNGGGLVIVLLLVALDISLGFSTGWLAFSRTSQLDEREALLRDRSYRIAYRLIAVGVLIMFGLIFFVGGILAGADPNSMQVAAVLPDGLPGRTIVALVEMLVILPTAVIAWMEPAADDHALSASTWISLAAVPLIALAWVALMSFAPDQLLTQVGSNNVAFSEANAACEHYVAQRRVGLGFGAAMRVGAEVCWNGQKAFVVGDPRLTPAGASLPQEATPYLRNVFSCVPYPTDVDFATTSEHCVEQIASDGTMTLTARGRVGVLPYGLAGRDLQVQLVVNREGKVLFFG